MFEDNDDVNYQNWKSRKNLKKHTFRNSNAVIELLGSKNRYYNSGKVNTKKFKNFSIHLNGNENEKMQNRFLEEIPAFDEKFLSYKQNNFKYSLNKKGRWLFPELIDSMDNFKTISTEEKNTKKTNKLTKTIELVENINPSETKEPVYIAPCECNDKIKFCYKNGNRYIVKKSTKCECVKPQVEKSPQLVFEFDNGYTERFNRIQTCTHSKDNDFKKKNYRFKARSELIECIKDEIEEEKRVIKVKKEEKEVTKKYPKYAFYVLKRKLMPKIREGPYKFEFIYGNKSFTDEKSIRNVLLKSLEEIQSSAFLTKSNFFTEKTLVCSICFGNYSCLLNLQCHHSACHRCWISYINNEITNFMVTNSSPNVKPISCMYENCNTSLGIDFLSNLLKSETVEKYKNYYYELELIRSSKYTVCPSNNCNKIIVKSEKQTTSICNCNYMICNLCKLESHHPISCDNYKSYKLKFKNFNPNSVTQGKFCPRCSRYIEKNGGCNHMKCICGLDFCWRCSTPMNSHTNCVEVQSFSFNQDFFVEEIDPVIYQCWQEQRHFQAKIENSGYEQIEKSWNKFLIYDDYKSFKLYFIEKLKSSSSTSPVNVDELIKNTLTETFYLLKQISSFCEKTAYMQHPRNSSESKAFSTQHLKRLNELSKSLSNSFFGASSFGDYFQILKYSKYIKNTNFII
jgi:hypothetical protein